MRLPSHLKLVCLCLSLLATFIGGAASQAAPQEYEVKAAYIFNFAKFIDWPPESFPDPSSPVVVGVLGTDPFGDFLDHTFSGRSVQGRPLVAKRVTSTACSECHILFVSSSEAGRLREILEANRGSHVVTISDIPQFDAKGGIIRMFMQESKVRFAINTQAAASAGVRISSQLLKLSQPGGGP